VLTALNWHDSAPLLPISRAMVALPRVAILLSLVGAARGASVDSANTNGKANLASGGLKHALAGKVRNSTSGPIATRTPKSGILKPSGLKGNTADKKQVRFEAEQRAHEREPRDQVGVLKPGGLKGKGKSMFFDGPETEATDRLAHKGIRIASAEELDHVFKTYGPEKSLFFDGPETEATDRLAHKGIRIASAEELDHVFKTYGPEKSLFFDGPETEATDRLAHKGLRIASPE